MNFTERNINELYENQTFVTFPKTKTFQQKSQLPINFAKHQLSFNFAKLQLPSALQDTNCPTASQKHNSGLALLNKTVHHLHRTQDHPLPSKNRKLRVKFAAKQTFQKHHKRTNLPVSLAFHQRKNRSDKCKSENFNQVQNTQPLHWLHKTQIFINFAKKNYPWTSKTHLFRSKRYIPWQLK